MATRKKIGRPAKKADKRAATKHFAGDKVGPHGPMTKDCDGPFLKGAQACRPEETVEESNARHIQGAKTAFDNLKAQVEGMLAANGIKVYTVKNGDPLPDELKAIVDNAVRGALMVATGDKLNAGEALYGFTGWLTTRKVPIHLCSNADVPPVLELLQAFIDAHGLPGCRPDWDKRLVRMAEVKPEVGNSWPVNTVRPTREEVAGSILRYLQSFGDAEQNKILANVLDELKAHREVEYNRLLDQVQRVDERKAALADADRELDHILRGDYTIVRQ